MNYFGQREFSVRNFKMCLEAFISISGLLSNKRIMKYEEWTEFLNLEISGNYGKEIICKPRKICTKYIPYSHTASLAVGCKFHSELPISQSKEKKNLLKIWFNEYLQDLKRKVAQMKHNHPCVGLKEMSPWSLPKGCWLGYRQCVPGYTCIR